MPAETGPQRPLRLLPDGNDNPNAKVADPTRHADVQDSSLKVCWADGQNDALSVAPSDFGNGPVYFSPVGYRPPAHYSRAGTLMRLPRTVRLIAHGFDTQNGGFFGGVQLGVYEAQVATALRGRIRDTYQGDADAGDPVNFVYFNATRVVETGFLCINPSFVWRPAFPPNPSSVATFDGQGFLGGECLDIFIGSKDEWAFDPSQWPSIEPDFRLGGFRPSSLPSPEAIYPVWEERMLRSLRHQYKYFARYQCHVFARDFTASTFEYLKFNEFGTTLFDHSENMTDGSAAVLQGWCNQLADYGFTYGGPIGSSYSADDFMGLVTDFFQPP
jgi:hypothetical protein